MGSNTMLSRRQALSTTAKFIGAVAGGALGQSRAEPAWAGAAAAARASSRVPYGTCVRLGPLETEVDYRAAVLSHCQQVTSEGGMNWIDIRPTRQQFNFDQGDRVLAFAEANGMAMRGSPLVWYGAMPDWTKNIRSAGEAERELTGHIERVMSRYRGKIKTWYVVNEPIDETKGAVPGLRPSVWLQQLGEKYIDLAFRTAQRVDPSAELLLNEYDIESADGTSPKRRQVLMKLINDLLARGVPLHGIGLQGHLNGKFQIDRDGLYNFVSEIRSLGLTVHVTELDVGDYDLPGSTVIRDSIVATRAHDFLEAVFAAARPSVITTWGITDRYTWMPTWFKRKDGLINRPLPFDEHYRPKPLWNVIDYFCQKTT
jgi:endo-1,4-beta-xylanase